MLGFFYSTMNILVIDNYDSFTYNLVHFLEPMGKNVEVYRSDEISADAIGSYERVVYSPGPGLPSESKIMYDILQKWGKQIPILGICLGHQAIVEFFGGTLTNLEEPLHGRSIQSYQTNGSDLIFRSVPTTFETGRYHSWGVKQEDLPSVLQPTAIDNNGYVMGLKHHMYNIRGLQFHPESVLTPQGKTILKNWIELC
jgi:anthranilate synthase component 2